MSTPGNKAAVIRKGGPPAGIGFARPVENLQRHLTPQTILPQSESANREAEATSSLTVSDATNITGCDTESTLTGLIERLWSIDQDKTIALNQSRQERANTRSELAKHLSELKALLGGRGRDGAWLPFLRQLRIPRSTAEGLIKKHLSGSEKDKMPRVLPALTKESLPKLLNAIKPKLVAINTRELADQFVRELVAVLDEQVAQPIELESSPEDRDRSPAEPTAQMLDHEALIPITVA
jgi:hypothetical protein